MSSPLLLDTCAAIWLVDGLLPESPLKTLTERYDLGEPVFLSPITGWEMGMLFSKGRFRSAVTPTEYLRRLMNVPGLRIADMSPELLLGSWFLPGNIHRDPADRIIAATAREYGLTVMTRDRSLLTYASEGHLSAVEC